MRAFVIVGTSGSGKSTLAASLADRLDLRLIERDAYNHTDDPADDVPVRQRAGVLQAIDSAADGWVLDAAPYWYEEDVYPRADAIIALDYPKLIVLWRCLRRFMINVASRRERLRDFLREDHAIRWAWKVHSERRQEIAVLAAELGGAVHMFKSPRATASWLRGVTA